MLLAACGFAAHCSISIRINYIRVYVLHARKRNRLLSVSEFETELDETALGIRLKNPKA